MDDNPYSAPAASDAAQNAIERLPLRTVAVRGAKGGALIGMGIFGVVSVLFVAIMLILATLAETRRSGGFMIVIDRMREGRSILEMIGGFVVGLAVFAGWGAIIGTIARTLSEWSRR